RTAARIARGICRWLCLLAIQGRRRFPPHLDRPACHAAWIARPGTGRAGVIRVADRRPFPRAQTIGARVVGPDRMRERRGGPRTLIRALPSHRLFPALAMSAFVVLLPLLFPSAYYYRIAALVFVFALAAVGLNLLMGFAGQVSLGHAGFMGIGAYAVAIGPT